MRPAKDKLYDLSYTFFEKDLSRKKYTNDSLISSSRLNNKDLRVDSSSRSLLLKEKSSSWSEKTNNEIRLDRH